MRTLFRDPHLRWVSVAPALSMALCGCADGTPAASVEPSSPGATAQTSATASIAPSTAPTAAAPASSTVSHKVGARPAAQHPRDPKLYPDPRLTPGAVLPVGAAQVSVPGYASRARDVPVSEKRDVFAEYGLSYPQGPGSFECDHFIPLCLGGSNTIQNLWPEPAPQFHWKDGLELYLWHEVRSGGVSLAEAQREIRTNWYAYWVKDGRPGSKSDADTVAATPAAPSTRSSSGQLIVGWSVAGARYHYLSCEYFLKIKPANRRTGTVARAKAAGKTPCKVCGPPSS